MRVVHREIERRERKLSAIKDSGGRLLCVVHLLNDVGRNLFRGIAIISREGVEHFLVPNPVLEHLRGRFDEIAWNMRAGETSILGAGSDFVQAMSELVEQRFYVGMGHE